MNERIKKLFEHEKTMKIIIAAGIVGIALIFLSSFNFGGIGSEKGDREFSVEGYGEQMESDLEETLSSITGVGRAKVLLTMENSVEYHYLKDSTTKTKEVEPKIRGVLVVCEGGDDPVVIERITESVTKALGISAAKVCITKLSE